MSVGASIGERYHDLNSVGLVVKNDPVAEGMHGEPALELTMYDSQGSEARRLHVVSFADRFQAFLLKPYGVRLAPEFDCSYARQIVESHELTDEQEHTLRFPGLYDGEGDVLMSLKFPGMPGCKVEFLDDLSVTTIAVGTNEFCAGVMLKMAFLIGRSDQIYIAKYPHAGTRVAAHAFQLCEQVRDGDIKSPKNVDNGTV